jgi:hypothetical protein
MKPQREGSGWRELLLLQNAQAIWDKIASTVRTVRTGDDSPPDQLTQDLFIRLLVTDRLRFYIESRFTDDQIDEDILSLIAR